MSDLYELKSIDGKGLGAIAKKNIKRGTLILKEDPVSDDGNMKFGPEWIKSVWESFKKIDILEQEEYLKLSSDNRPSNLGFLIPWIDKMYGNESPSTRQKILLCLEVFKSNCWDEESSYGICNKQVNLARNKSGDTVDTGNEVKKRRVYIHSSRFNHSCQPNVRMWKLPDYGYQMFCRATRKIKAGEELTFSYTSIIPFGLKNREFRQKYINDEHDMICSCDFCKAEVEDKNDIEAFEAFEKEELELKRLTDENEGLKVPSKNEGLKVPSIEDLNDYEAICQNTMKQIRCYKNIYNLGKKNNIAWNYLYRNVIFAGGISTIMSAYNMAVSSQQFDAFFRGNGVDLLAEVDQLLKAGKAMDDALGVTDEERFMWQGTQDQFKKMMSAIQKSPRWDKNCSHK